MMVDFAQQLLTSHPTEAALAFEPLVSLFGEVFDDAAAANAIRPEVRRSAIAGMVLEAIMFNAFSATISGMSIRAGDSDPAEELWDLILHGVGVSDPGCSDRSALGVGLTRATSPSGGAGRTCQGRGRALLARSDGRWFCHAW